MLIASPIYYGSLSADTYAFLERFWFSASRYDAERPSKMKHPLPSGLIVTMNISHPEYYQPMLDNILRCQNALIGPARLLTVGDTCQFDHYENYHCTIFDGRHKETRRITEQSEDYERAPEIHERASHPRGGIITGREIRFPASLKSAALAASGLFPESSLNQIGKHKIMAK